MRKVAIIQARLNSSRLPNKVLLKIGKLSIIEIINKKLKKSKRLDDFVFCIPDDKENFLLRNYLKKRKINYFTGSNKNVLERYFKTAVKYKADTIIRITSDCPLLDVDLIDEMIVNFERDELDFYDNNSPSTFPDGLDIEIFSFKMLREAKRKAKSDFDLEYVTTFMKRLKTIKRKNFTYKNDLSKFRFTVDESSDFNNFDSAYKKIGTSVYDWKKLILFLKKDKKLCSSFISDKRNEGAFQNKGQKIWLHAKNLIGGGNSMISKNPEFYPSKDWPVYFSKASGCHIWDLEGKKYLDFTTMGIGTNILGYKNKLVDNSVLRAINKGNVSTLNCIEEVELAEELLKIDSWASKVCFARTGGEANAIAIRLARLQAGKRTKVLACGYHGWHDWYLASKNKETKKIQKDQLPLYSNKGIPNELKGSIEFFEYNNIKDFSDKLKKDKKIGIIKMETMRNEFPKNNFLQKIQKIAKNKNLIFILDECTTGFRERYGGLYAKYNLKPDMVIYGKALGNGYAITAVLGKKRIMENYYKSFISSTFWSERIGFCSALATLKAMKKIKSWKRITQNGIFVRKKWKLLAQKYKLKINIIGIPALSSFVFLNENRNIYNAIITQEMLKKNILATNTIYFSVRHTKKLIKKYLINLEKVFKLISSENLEDLKKRVGLIKFKKFR